MMIQTHCPDGTDRHCSSTVSMELSYSGLTLHHIQMNWTENKDREELESVTITPPADPRWLIENDAWLRQQDIDSIKANSYFELEADDFPPHGTYGPCGSSETYDDEGNNITAV